MRVWVKVRVYLFQFSLINTQSSNRNILENGVGYRAQRQKLEIFDILCLHNTNLDMQFWNTRYYPYGLFDWFWWNTVLLITIILERQHRTTSCVWNRRRSFVVYSSSFYFIQLWVKLCYFKVKEEMFILDEATVCSM